jgi:DNA-binding PadR family transcriptional regulator
MEFVILGLLMIRGLSQYDIRKALQQKVSPFYSASLGSIQAALKKLEGNGHIEINEVIENGRGKKIYTINHTGRQYFMDWMLSSIAPNRLDRWNNSVQL